MRRTVCFRRRFTRHRVGHRRRFTLRRLLGFAVLCIVILCVYVETRLPAVNENLREASLRSYAHTCIAETADQLLLDMPSASGSDSITLDTYALSSVKSEFTKTLQQALSGKVISWVPIGNLTGISILNGRGMKVPIRFSVDGIANVETETVLTAVGINRTKYSVVMHITAELYCLHVDNPEVVTVTTDYTIYETILKGDIPKYYAGYKS